MPVLIQQVAVDASREKVWEVLADFSAVANWAPTISESRSTTEANGGVGAERGCEHEKMGTIHERIVAWDEGHSLSYDVIDGLPFPMKSLNNVWEVRTQGDGALVTLTMDFTMKMGPFGLLPALMARRPMNKEMRVTLAGLKQYVETGEIVATTEQLDQASIAAVEYA